MDQLKNKKEIFKLKKLYLRGAFCVFIFIALIISITEQSLNPMLSNDDEPPRDIHQERNIWEEFNTTIGTATPSPSPSHEVPDFTSF